jgi:crotonobetainyl-CoA:carnitine CoA-transferase CaiB-like acyl-CoA transferase
MVVSKRLPGEKDMKLLDGVQVIDLGSFITAPLAAMLVAELGADVIKVERPGGDPFRSFGQGLYSPHFQAHNRHKRSVVVDYGSPEGLAELYRLLDKADVVVLNSRPGVAEQLGLGWDVLRHRNPRLIYCAITGFGQDGPYAQRAAFDNVGQALSGWMSRFRTGDDPRVAGPAVSDAATGCYAALGIVAALFEREKSGQGHRIDLSMIEATMALGAEPLGQFLATGRVSPVFERGAMSQAFTVTCADGKRIGLHLSSPDKFWHGLCRAIEQPGWVADYPNRLDRVRGYDRLAAAMAELFKRQPRAFWIARLVAEDVPFAPEYELDELESDPQIRHLDLFHTVEHPTEGRVRMPHRALRIDGSREIDYRPPPTLGEHNDEIVT